MKINMFCSAPKKPENFVDGVKKSTSKSDKVAVSTFSALATQLTQAASPISLKLKGTLDVEAIESLVAILAQATIAGKEITVRCKVPSEKGSGQFAFVCNDKAKLEAGLQANKIAIRNN